MKRLFAVMGVAVLAAAASVIAVASPSQAATGFHVSNGRLYDANGSDFVMRGVNHPWVWFQSQNSSFAAIKAAGANTVRVVLDQGITTGQVNTVVGQCRSNRLVCVLEIHSTTGYSPGSGKITLSQAADAWLRVKNAFIGQEQYVLINLGNEPYASGTDTGWITQTRAAISKLRAGGVNHTLIADAPAWGQDNNRLMLNNAASILASDPQHNVVFSVHMYSVYSSASTVSSYINYFADHRLPLIVGEFGWQLHGSPVAWSAVLSSAQSRSIGWLAWSWSGNGGDDAPLDMTNGFNPNSLTGWGNNIINGANGLKATSRQASVYGGTSGGGTGGGSGAGTAPNGYPYCVNGRSSDPDGDGWGWEGNASCVVRGSTADSGSGAGSTRAPNGYPYCVNGRSSDPDGDGWGWEGNASCVVRGSTADSGSGAGSTRAPNGYPYCVNGRSSDPDGDGWGWEGNASCVVRGSTAGSGSGAGSTRAPNGYPYCVNGRSSDPDGDGWGWEGNASCVVRGSTADL